MSEESISEESMRSLLRPALTLLGLFSVLTGLVYPLAITGVAQAAWPSKANGSLLRDGQVVVGSELIGQRFDEPRYFWGRPSATAAHPYDAAASSGSNLGPTNPVLTEAIRERLSTLRSAHPSMQGPVPVDLVTASGSGLDPHVSPAAALYQVGRVARARGLSEVAVRDLVRRHIEGRLLGLFGEPRVNVLRLNLALDALPEAPQGE
jgi:K+-transporting ATPase ATPase C chain